MGVTDITAQFRTPFPISIPFPWAALGWLSLQGAQPKAGVKHPVSCDDEVLAKPEQDNIPAIGLQLHGKREIPQRWILFLCSSLEPEDCAQERSGSSIALKLKSDFEA